MVAPVTHRIIAAANHVLDAVRAVEVDRAIAEAELHKARALIDAELRNMAPKWKPLPLCECGHGKALHRNGRPCTRRESCGCAWGWTPA